MTDEQIIEMAEQTGCLEKYQVFYFTNDELKTFAKLVAQHEREACAKLIESRKTGANELMDVVRDMETKAIRERNET